jgi:hypothetical protein
MAFETQQRINFPDFLGQLRPRSRRNAPCLRREMLDDFNRRACERTTPLLRCCRRLSRCLLLCPLFTLPAMPAHLAGTPVIVTHHMQALAWNVLRDRRDAPTLMHLKSRMHATTQIAHSIQRQQSNFDQECNHPRAKHLLQRRLNAGEVRVYIATIFMSKYHMKIVLTIKQSIRDECVQVGMKVEIFAECVDRHHDAWNTVMRSCANTACVGKRVTQNIPHALMRDAAELLEQTAAKSKVRPQPLWNRESEMPMRHRRHDRIREHCAEHLHLLLMAWRAEPTTVAGNC